MEQFKEQGKIEALKSLPRFLKPGRDGEEVSRPIVDSASSPFSSSLLEMSRTPSSPESAAFEQKVETNLTLIENLFTEKSPNSSFSQAETSSSWSSVSNATTVSLSTPETTISDQNYNLSDNFKRENTRNYRKQKRKLEKEKSTVRKDSLFKTEPKGFAATVLKLESKIKENATSSNTSTCFYTIKRGCASAKGKLLGTIGIFTLDTGAGVNIVSLDYWRLLKGTKAVFPYSGADIVGPEGSSIEPVGWVEADITLAGQTFRHPVVLARKFNQRVLLGTDFMFEIGLVLDVQDGKCWLRDKPLSKFLLAIDLQQAIRSLAENTDLARISPGNPQFYSQIAEKQLTFSDSTDIPGDWLTILDLASSGFSLNQENQLQQLLFQYSDIFSSKPGRTNIVKHHIDVGDARSIKQGPYRLLNPERKAECTRQSADMLKSDVAEPSFGPCASPVTFVPKKNGTLRFCIDFRKLNEVTIKDTYPIPRIDDTLDTLKGAKYFNTLDLSSGFWQVELDEDIDNVLNRIKESGLTLKPSKCFFCRRELKYLGHIVSADGIRPDPDKLEAVRSFSVPSKPKDVRAFLGLTGYYRRFIKNYAEIAEPLFESIREKHNPVFVFTPDRQQAFELLKERLISAPIVTYPNFDHPFMLQLDACDYGLGAVLAQNIMRKT
ncbi:unnamed protein product [Didymodactylos carnosus]|uniref:Uncharacterized protein n=1 Tax=Didymodactylos carnosus TaxID=1234261 RepID=A0A8S2GUM8_9BILA|nr:unnamed protein product [Didymodactylos carnosus]CAF3564262.1 unnamed protein product [Didymodactylos carnosus]